MSTLNAGKISEIPPGSSKVLEVDERQIAIFNVEGKIYALNNVCPHAGGPLGEGELEGKIVTCPWHAWQFDVTSGDCVTVPQSRQGCFSVRVEADEVIVELGS
jgi:nitrite reductase (NADH) small subunit